MRIELLRGAEADLLEHFIRCEERSIGRGDRLYESVDRALELLRQQPEMAPVYRGNVRRLVLRPFDLGVFYSIEGERLMIGAILDLRQGPDAIERRLQR
jgi:plasmid stabilization system protein ParE